MFLEFIEHGWTPALAEKLWLPRQALHFAEIDLTLAGLKLVFRVGIPRDMENFCRERGMSNLPCEGSSVHDLGT